MSESLSSSVPDELSSDIQTLVNSFGARAIKAPKNQVIRPCCSGLDVHKNILMLAVCITDPDSSEVHFNVMTFKSTNSEIIKLADMLLELNIKDICMESTGKYWIPVYNILEQKGLNPVLTHPKYVKQLPGKKTDYADAIHIASMFRLNQIVPSFIPPQDFRDLRELCRYRLKITYYCSSEKNRFQNCMTISRIRIDSILSDPFGKSASALMAYLLETPEEKVTDEGILNCINKRVRASNAEILDSVHGFHFVDIQKFKMKMIKKNLSNFNSILDEIDGTLSIYREKYQKQICHLVTMVGVTKISALYILAEIGINMDVWRSAESLCCWAGLTPGNHDSGGKHTATKCNHGGHYLKPLLIQLALAAVQSTKKDPYFFYKYQKIRKRRGNKRAIIAIARMMMIAIYHMLKDDKDFHPCDYDEIIGHTSKEKVELNFTNTLQFLEEQGVDEETINHIREQCHIGEDQSKTSVQTSEGNETGLSNTKTRVQKTQTSESRNSKKKQPSKEQKKKESIKDNLPGDSTTTSKIPEPTSA